MKSVLQCCPAAIYRSLYFDGTQDSEARPEDPMAEYRRESRWAASVLKVPRNVHAVVQNTDDEDRGIGGLVEHDV
jgi:hypothetical protein